MALGICMICGNPITRNFDVCSACERAYKLDVPKREWPAWARQMVADHRAEQRQEIDMIVNLPDVPDQYGRICYGDGALGDGMDDNGTPLDDYAGAWEQLREMGIESDLPSR